MECKLANSTIYYEVFGEGRPVLALHGWPVDHRTQMTALEPIFQQRPGWQRFYPDWPGMGRTPGADWITSQDQMLEVMLDFIDHVIPGQSFALAGGSYGGYMARGVVYRRAARVDGLMLCAPRVHPTQRRLPPPLRRMAATELIASLNPEDAAVYQRYIYAAVAPNRQLIDFFRDAIQPAIDSADQQFLTQVEQNDQFSFPVDTLPEPFRKPALIITGRQDITAGYLDAWGLVENFPLATFAVLDCGGHCLEMERQTLYHALVNDWLDRIETATP